MNTWEYNWWDDRTTEQNEINFCPILNDFCYEGNDACRDCVTLKTFQEYYNRRPKE